MTAAAAGAAPDWFLWALDQPCTSRTVAVAGCPIHYLLWPAATGRRGAAGVLFVHGGGAHARWWAPIAPFLARDRRVAAIDLSGMGDSGRRPDYDAALRAQEMLAVIDDAELGERPVVVGHSFGGYMTMKFGATHGARIAGAVIVDSPIRRPDEETRNPRKRPTMGSIRYYESRQEAVGRFRLMPEQPCENEFLIDYIARHSVRETEAGWCWKFDPRAMGARRFGEPFHEYLQALQCRAALIFGEQSALVSRETAVYMSYLMGPRTPVVEIPRARHHVTLDQPLAFVAALRTLLESWAA